MMGKQLHPANNVDDLAPTIGAKLARNTAKDHRKLYMFILCLVVALIQVRGGSIYIYIYIYA